MTSEEKIFIKKFLTLDSEVHSCLCMALKSGRKHTGRDIKTGKDIRGLINDEVWDNNLFHSEYFTGLTTYLILLEQIGSVFMKVGYDVKDKKNGILIALDNFCNQKLTEDQIYAISALRNSLVHNFGLASQNYSTKYDSYKFCLYFSNKSMNAITPYKWDGKYTGKDDKTNTEVSVSKMCEFIESVYSNLLVEFENDTLFGIATRNVAAKSKASPCKLSSRIELYLLLIWKAGSDSYRNPFNFDIGWSLCRTTSSKIFIRYKEQGV